MTIELWMSNDIYTVVDVVGIFQWISGNLFREYGYV